MKPRKMNEIECYRHSTSWINPLKETHMLQSLERNNFVELWLKNIVDGRPVLSSKTFLHIIKYTRDVKFRVRILKIIFERRPSHVDGEALERSYPMCLVTLP